MKSLGKLRKFALHKNDAAKEKRDSQFTAHVDELAQASQDMQDMRNCYDSLLSAAAATANSAYEFSESLREMGSCLVEKTSINDDEGKVLLMLGKVQFELQRLVDGYRSHIFQTITNPSESLLNELRTVEEMKRQCDEKRNVYEYMKAQQREKGRSKSGKGESLQQLTEAQDEYNDEATLCVFRLKSLKQGQSRSLLTQAARHHAAQLNFFRKGLKSLEAIEQHLRVVTEREHIDYEFSGLEDDVEDGDDDGENGYDASDIGELSFDYAQNKRGIEVAPATRNSMELDQGDISFPQASTMETMEVNPEKNHGDLPGFSREPRPASYSAPIFAEKSDPSDRMRQMQASTRKLHRYVLPMPAGANSSTPSRTSSSVPRTRPTGHDGGTHNLWHSSPLEPKKHEKDSGDNKMSGPTISEAQTVLRESNSNNAAIRIPPPLAEGLSLLQLDTQKTYDTRKVKRHAYSGPLTSRSLPTKPILTSSGPIASAEAPQLLSGLLSRVPIPQPSSPKVSPGASPPLVSSPRINELHELPRPPVGLATKPARNTGLVGHSAPLISRNELSATNKIPSIASNAASPLPTPPVPRSFSIPSSSQRGATLHVTKLLESSQDPEKAEEVNSPPLTPISLPNIKSTSTISVVASQSSNQR